MSFNINKCKSIYAAFSYLIMHSGKYLNFELNSVIARFIEHIWRVIAFAVSLQKEKSHIFFSDKLFKYRMFFYPCPSNCFNYNTDCGKLHRMDTLLCTHLG